MAHTTRRTDEEAVQHTSIGTEHLCFVMRRAGRTGGGRESVRSWLPAYDAYETPGGPVCGCETLVPGKSRTLTDQSCGRALGRPSARGPRVYPDVRGGSTSIALACRVYWAAAPSSQLERAGSLFESCSCLNLLGRKEGALRLSLCPRSRSRRTSAERYDQPVIVRGWDGAPGCVGRKRTLPGTPLTRILSFRRRPAPAPYLLNYSNARSSR